MIMVKPDHITPAEGTARAATTARTIPTSPTASEIAPSSSAAYLSDLEWPDTSIVGPPAALGCTMIDTPVDAREAAAGKCSPAATFAKHGRTALPPGRVGSASGAPCGGPTRPIGVAASSAASGDQPDGPTSIRELGPTSPGPLTRQHSPRATSESVTPFVGACFTDPDIKNAAWRGGNRHLCETTVSGVT